eukprot:COSAG06_NODE_59852_length_273_cov_0.477011_1_plen_65_part_10
MFIAGLGLSTLGPLAASLGPGLATPGRARAVHNLDQPAPARVFFKQKTAYEMESRDWSSDVCSSD